MQEEGLFIVPDLKGHGTMVSAKGSPYFITSYNKQGVCGSILTRFHTKHVLWYKLLSKFFNDNFNQCRLSYLYTVFIRSSIYMLSWSFSPIFKSINSTEKYNSVMYRIFQHKSARIILNFIICVSCMRHSTDMSTLDCRSFVADTTFNTKQSIDQSITDCLIVWCIRSHRQHFSHITGVFVQVLYCIVKLECFFPKVFKECWFTLNLLLKENIIIWLFTKQFQQEILCSHQNVSEMYCWFWYPEIKKTCFHHKYIC